jgi:hypothetical protein
MQMRAMGVFLLVPEPELLNGTSRQPRIALTINGIQVTEIISASIHQNNFYAADHFVILVAVSDTTLIWAQADIVQINLRIAQDQGSTKSVIIGEADEVALDLASGTVTIRGRDYTAQFIETKTAEKFQNLTSSQVISKLAGRHSLTSQVTATTTPTGKYYDTDHAFITNEVSEWTLMTYLAGREGFDIFFSGSTLYFQPAADPNVNSPFEIFCSTSGTLPVSNVQRLSLHRNLTLARDVIVKVISWNHEMKVPITAIQRAKKSKVGQTGSPPPTTYIFRETGLSQSQAEEFAQAKLKELVLHERRIEFDIPGDLTVTPRSLIRLSGTGTDFDQIYFVAQVILTCTLAKGFSMRVMAKNASPHTVVYS